MYYKIKVKNGMTEIFEKDTDSDAVEYFKNEYKEVIDKSVLFKYIETPICGVEIKDYVKNNL